MSTDILPSPEPEAPPSARSPLRLALSAAVLVLVLALVVGVTVAVRGLSGGGSQPEDALPGGAFAFAKVDLDPSAGQKINALRFLRKFPALRDKVSLNDDLRETLFESVSESAGWEELDFDKDVDPWLGSRIAIAAYPPAEDAENTGGSASSGAGFASAEAVAAPARDLAPTEAPLQPEDFGQTFDPEELAEEFGKTFDPEEFAETFDPDEFEEEFDPDGDGGELGSDVDGSGELGPFGAVPNVVVALQVTDAAKARAGLDKLIAASPDAPKPGIVFQGDYALLAPDQDAADKAAKDAKAGVLSAEENFSSDLDALGDGVASAWLDMDGMGALAGLTGLVGTGAFGLGGTPSGGEGSAGRTSYVVKFDGADAVEVRGAVTGAEPIPGSGQELRGFGELPDDSVVAFGLAGGDALVPTYFEQLRRTFDGMGADGPEGGFDDMLAEAEKDLGIALPEDLAVLLGSNLVGSLQAGTLRDGDVQVGARVSTDGRRAMSVIDKLKKSAAFENEDVPVVSRLTDDGMIVASSAAHADRLAAGGSLGRRDVVAKAMPDIEGSTMALWVDIRGIAAEFTEDVDENLEPLEGVGLTVRLHDDGSADYRLRLITD
jgi:hypothetical protein